MLKKMYFLPCAFLAVLFTVAACSNPKSPQTAKPAVTGVTISPNNSDGNEILVEKGKTRQFNATVEVTGGAAQTVNWTVTGKGPNSATAISNTGLLTIDAEETAAELTVTATATADSTKKADVTVTVVNPGEGPKVTGVTISPKEVSVRKGDTKEFTAEVEVTGGGDTAVNWTVAGNNSDNTAIDEDGLLTVGEDEDAAELTVTATSVLDETKSDSATVTVVSADAEKLPTVGKPQLSAQGVASWTGLTDESKVSGYSVELFKDSNPVSGTGATARVNAYSHDFLPVMRQSAGLYTVKVTAKGNNTDSVDSDPSEASDPQTVVHRSKATGLAWTGDTATWTGDTTGLGYQVKLYKDNTFVKGYDNVSGTSQSFASDITDSGSYTFTVTALGNAYLIVGADESDKSPPYIKMGQVWLVGIPNWDFPKGTLMTEEAGTFTWAGDVAADSTFRFSLTDTTGWTDKWNGNWYAPDVDNKAAVIGDNAITYYGTNTSEGATEATSNAWKISAAGYYTITLKPAELKMTVAKPKIVTSVTVTGPNSANAGSSTAHYTASVAGHNDPDQGVTWSVTGGGAGTSIATNGILTVSGTEAAGTELTIKATSTVNTGVSGTRIVTVSAVGSTPLPQVPKPTLSEAGVATWTYASDANVTHYYVRLYKEDVLEGAAMSVDKGTLTKDLRSTIQDVGAGSYTVTVTAVGDGTTYTTSEDSEKSEAQVFTQRPQVQNTWWFESGTARWVNPDGEGSGDYTIQLYKKVGTGNASPVGDPRSAERNNTDNPDPVAPDYETVTDYDFAYVGVPAEVGAQYSFSVTALGNGALVLDSLPSGISGEREYSALGDSKVWTIVKGGSVYLAGADKGKIAYSSDGKTWYLSNQAVFGKSDAVRGIAYGGGKFVAVGYNGKAAYSSDGSIWTQITSISGSTNILSIAYGNSIFVAAGDGGNVWYSGDGTAWTHDAGWSGGPFNGVTLNGQNILSIAYGDAKFVAVGHQGIVAYSSEGKTWTFSHHATGGENAGLAINSIAYGNGKFVMIVNDIGDFWLTNKDNDVMWCDGTSFGTSTTWNQVQSGMSQWYDSGSGGWRKRGLEQVIYDGARFIIVGTNETINKIGVVASADGATWAAIAPEATNITGTPVAQTETVTAAIVLSTSEILLAGPGRFIMVEP